MRVLYSFILFCCLGTAALAQETIWTGNTSQAWLDASNWSNGVPVAGGIVFIPPAPTGNKWPAVSSPLTVDFLLQNAGQIFLNAPVTNLNNIQNFNGGTLTNSSLFLNQGTLAVDNSGKFVNEAQVQNFSSINQSSTGLWENRPGSSFENTATGNFQNYGTVQNEGTWTNNGYFFTANLVVSSGPMTNNKTLAIAAGLGQLVISATGSFFNSTAAAFTEIKGLFDNQGLTENLGGMKTFPGATLINGGSLTNFNVMNNGGETINNGTFSNGCLTCGSSPTFWNEGGSIFRNNLTVLNFGTLELLQCSKFYQQATNNSHVGGSVWLMGIVYELAGTIDQSNIMGGIVLHSLGAMPMPMAMCKAATVTLDGAGFASITPQTIDNMSVFEYCGGSMTVSPASFDCSKVGPNTVTLTATDGTGQTSTCQSVVTVIGSAACQPVCQNVTSAGQIGSAQTGCAGFDPQLLTSISAPSGGSGELEFVWLKFLVDPVANPNSFTMIANSNASTYDPGPVSQTTWFRRCARRSGCSEYVGESNNVKITVVNTPPVAICKSITVQLSAAGSVSITAAQIDNGSTGGCGTISSYSISKTTFTSTGSFTVVLTVTNSNGQTSTCQSTVTVVPFTPTFDPTKCYKIVNKESGKSLDISGGSTADNAKLIQKTGNAASLSQAWTISPSTFSGFWTISNKNSGKYCDVGYQGDAADFARITQWYADGSNSQAWEISPVGGGYFKIVNKYSGKSMKLSAHSTADGVEIMQLPFVSTYEHAKWTIVEIPCPTPPPACNKTAVLVVGCTTLSAGDLCIKNRLVSLGLTVTVKLDASVQAADVAGKGIVVISSSSNSASIGNRLTGVGVPILCWEPYLFDDLKMCSTVDGTDYGSYGNCSKLNILNSSHPIANGYSGTQTCTTTSSNFCFGKPSASAVCVADLYGYTGKRGIFCYEKGNSMCGLNAPERRTGFCLQDQTPSCLSSTGWKLFDNAVKWTMNCSSLNVLAAQASQSELVFDAWKSGYDVELKWVSRVADPNAKFTVERSDDGLVFEKIATIDGLGETYFSETDRRPLEGDNYYRLLVRLSDGSETMSDARLIRFEKISDFTVFPNPADESAFLDLRPLAGKTASLRFFNPLGREVKKLEISEVADEPLRLDLSEFANGLHQILVESEGSRPRSVSLLIQKID